MLNVNSTLEIFFGYLGIRVERQRVSGGEHLRAVDSHRDLGVLGLHLERLGRGDVPQQLAHLLQVVDVLVETLAALVEPVAVQRDGGAPQVSDELGVLARRGQQLGRLLERRLLQLEAQLLGALQEGADGRLELLRGRVPLSLFLQRQSRVTANASHRVSCLPC